jgi:hypothetical protein
VQELIGAADGPAGSWRREETKHVMEGGRSTSWRAFGLRARLAGSSSAVVGERLLGRSAAPRRALRPRLTVAPRRGKRLYRSRRDLMLDLRQH